MTRLLPALAALILIVAGGAWYLGRPASDAVVTAAIAQEDTGTTAVTEIELVPDVILGDPAAPVTVIEYASYTCPHCANFHEDQFKKLKAEYVDTGKVQFIHREVYFDRFGLWAGLLANCGGEMRYFGISGMLYAQQEDWIGTGEPEEVVANLTTLGKTAGLSEEQINTCLNDKEMETRLGATFQTHAEADGINATPSLVIDGEKYSNMSYEALKEIIDAKLADG
jgi:protein-disulfide isomerase